MRQPPLARRKLLRSWSSCSYEPRAIATVNGSAKSDPLQKMQFAVTERREIASERCLIDVSEGCRPPMRLVVLVDQYRTDALVEIVALHEMLGQAVFEDQCGVEIEL